MVEYSWMNLWCLLTHCKELKLLALASLTTATLWLKFIPWKLFWKNTYVIYGAHIMTCQTPIFCKVLCLSFLEVSVQPLFFQIPLNLISFGLIRDTFFSNIKSSLIIPLLGALHFGGFKVFHSYLIAFRQTLERTQDNLSLMENLCSVKRPTKNAPSSFYTQLISTQKLCLRNSHS